MARARELRAARKRRKVSPPLPAAVLDPSKATALRVEGAEKPGRPVALTEAKREALLNALETSGKRTHSARYAGIHPATLFAYLKVGRDERLAAKGTDEEPPPGSAWELLNLIEAAESRFVLGAVERIKIAGQAGTWQADAWLLERIRPTEFGRTQRVEMGGAKGAGPIKVDAKVKGEMRGIVVLPPLTEDDDGEEPG